MIHQNESERIAQQNELEQIGTLAIETYSTWDALMQAIYDERKKDGYEPERLAFLVAEKKFKEAARLYMEQNVRNK